MNISVECMGASMRWCGSERLALELPDAATVGEALHRLSQRYPELASRRLKVAVAIGDEIVPQDRPIREGEIIALIPPVSGG
jgi:molybdopterin converting factor small subunit